MDSHDSNQPSNSKLGLVDLNSFHPSPTVLGFCPLPSFLLLLCRCRRWTRSSGGLAMPAPGTPITVSPHNYGLCFFFFWASDGVDVWGFFSGVCCCFVAGKLDEELGNWLRACGVPKSSDVRGVIAPWVFPFFSFLGRVQSLILWVFVSVSLFWCRHAGYSYSGRCAAFAFGNIDPSSMSVCLFLFFSFATFFSMYDNFSVSTGEVFFGSSCLVWWKFCIFRISVFLFII